MCTLIKKKKFVHHPIHPEVCQVLKIFEQASHINVVEFGGYVSTLFAFFSANCQFNCLLTPYKVALRGVDVRRKNNYNLFLLPSAQHKATFLY